MTKQTKSILKTAAQLQKDCQRYLKSSFQEIYQRCQEAVLQIQEQIKKNLQDKKQLRGTLNDLQKDQMKFQMKLKQGEDEKRRKPLNDKLKTLNAKIKEVTLRSSKVQKKIDSLKAQLVAIEAIKVKEKMREASIKMFEKIYNKAQSSINKEGNIEQSASVSTLHERILLNAGDKASEFSTVINDNQKISLLNFLGQSVVLYFYPKDNTPGCTKEANDFMAHLAEFTEKNAVILGVSRDSLSSHRNFKTNQKISYSLLSDTDGSICQSYGVLKNKKNREGKLVTSIERSTFLIDKKGIIQQIWRSVHVSGHVQEVLSSIIS